MSTLKISASQKVFFIIAHLIYKTSIYLFVCTCEYNCNCNFSCSGIRLSFVHMYNWEMTVFSLCASMCTQNCWPGGAWFLDVLYRSQRLVLEIIWLWFPFAPWSTNCNIQNTLKQQARISSEDGSSVTRVQGLL